MLCPKLGKQIKLYNTNSTRKWVEKEIFRGYQIKLQASASPEQQD
jgi:hypothetical protein